MTIRDARSGETYDVEFDGRYVVLKVTIDDELGEVETEVTLARSELLALLTEKP